ncbi:hypothetical protein Dda_6997 [Drechslerella dactyloides]|uniref:Uncharacterized protein n=1 Tax=Drechslerella dactyloides TaxID=74499 RepID=A0AAD6NIQ1_DREDA|nr:hypothetical protein Dda_6997 [Drechslerella dactyloides]
MSYLDIFTMASDALAGEPSQTALETIELLVNSKGIIDSRSIVISLVLRAIMEEDFEFQTQCGNGSLRSIRRSVDEVTLGLLFHLQVQFPDDKSMDEVYPNQITLEDLPTLLGLTGIVLGLYRRTDIPRKRLDDWVPQYIKTCCQITTSLRQLEVTVTAKDPLSFSGRMDSILNRHGKELAKSYVHAELKDIYKKYRDKDSSQGKVVAQLATFSEFLEKAFLSPPLLASEDSRLPTTILRQIKKAVDSGISNIRSTTASAHRTEPELLEKRRVMKSSHGPEPRFLSDIEEEAFTDDDKDRSGGMTEDKHECGTV